jgi:hypothetical protein
VEVAFKARQASLIEAEAVEYALQTVEHQPHCDPK